MAWMRDVRRMSETSDDASSIGLDKVSVENTHLGQRVLAVGSIRAQTRALALAPDLVRPALLGRVDLI
jgi:hypothetical protein